MKGFTEHDFTNQVLQLAKLYGWRSAHFRPARTAKGWRTAVSGDGKGFPDLILVKGQRLIVAELKMARGKWTIEQMDWMKAFENAGVKVFCWRPDDFEEIKKILGDRSYGFAIS